jgi:hypothetical protein
MARLIRTLGSFYPAADRPAMSAMAVVRTTLAVRLSAVIVAGLLCQSPLDAHSQQLAETGLVGPECANCEILVVPLVSFGDAEGVGMLDSDYNIVRTDNHGRYFVFGGLQPHFWVFDSSGRVTQRIGQSGEGPGEFGMIMEVTIGPADSLFVFDASLLRVTVYTPELEVARTFRFQFPLDGSALFVGTSILVNTGIHTADRVGLPFHVLERDGSLARSFGSVTNGVYRADLQDIIDRRQLAQSAENSFWAARLNQYVIERWTIDGRLMETLHWEPPWFQVWWRPQGDAETPPVATVIDLEQVGDTLWVLAAVPGDRWRSAVEPHGRLYRVTDPEEYQNAVLAAIDVRRGGVIASRRMPLLLQGLTEGGLAVHTEADAFGNPVVHLYRLEIHSSSKPRRAGT